MNLFILNGKWPLRKKLLTRHTIICSLCMPCADPEKFLRGGGGGVQIPRRGLAENFNMAKNNNLAIPGVGEVRTPVPPLDSPMYAYLSGHFYFFPPRFLGWDAPVPDRCILITFLIYLKTRL